MRTIKNIVFTAVAIVLLAACGEDYLEKNPTEFISNEDLETTAKINPAVVDGSLSGIYTLMITPGAGGLTAHEDFGHKSFDIISDLLSSDLALVDGAYNRWVALTNLLLTDDYTATIPNYMGWRYYYKIVKASNSIIAAMGGNDAVPEKADGKAILGQAKALRAYAYFYLAQFYAEEYNPETPILPIYTELNQPSAPKAKTSEVYALMVSDLTSAISLLKGWDRGTSKTNIDENVAKGLLAYVYAAMGKNAEAKQMADEVIASKKFTMMNAEEVTGGFTTVAIPGWMWGFDITQANNLNLRSWYGMMDFFSYSYQAAGNFKGMDSGLYAQIREGDIRKTQFGLWDKKNEKVIPGAGALLPINKFYDLKRVVMGQRNIEDDYVYMRVTEMYLLSAEMAAVQNQDSEAKSRLKEVLAERFANAQDYAYVDNLSGKALLDEIILQTRIEFLGEGKSYLLMKRRKMTKTRGENHLFYKGESFKYNDSRLTFDIPQEEIRNNTNISK